MSRQWIVSVETSPDCWRVLHVGTHKEAAVNWLCESGFLPMEKSDARVRLHTENESGVMDWSVIEEGVFES